MAHNGQIAIAVPLFRMHHSEELTGLDGGYSLQLSNNKPIAYAIDCGPAVGITLMNANFVEKNLEFLGEL